MTDKELNQIKETTQNGTYIDINTHFRDIKKLQSENTRQQAEIERLKEARTEIIKEFSERLKK